MSQITLKMQYNTDDDLARRGEGRARELARRLDVTPEQLSQASVLEVGCGYGEQCAALQDIYQARVVGIDPWPRIKQGPYAARDFYRNEDITAQDISKKMGPFDYICSYDVFEHIDKPRAALESVFSLLAPGGKAYLKYNLHRGASASHLMKYLDFPWVHLIHSEEEIRAMMRDKTGQDKGPAWVNRLTYAHYLQYFDEIGFKVLKVWYSRVKMPKDFYALHRDKLKCYPMEDLERNFMHATLQRPA